MGASTSAQQRALPATATGYRLRSTAACGFDCPAASAVGFVPLEGQAAPPPEAEAGPTPATRSEKHA